MPGAVQHRPVATARAREASAPPAKGLKPFASYYAEARKPPRMDGDIAGFDEKQARVIHELYWKANDTISFEDFAAQVKKHPAFKGHPTTRGSGVDKDHLAKLFGALPDSFPMPWRSRQLAASSRTLVEALKQAPQGTSVREVHAKLAAADKDFPTVGAFFQAAKDSWVKNPDRFPFLEGLRQEKGAYVLEALGKKDPNAFERTPSGSLQITDHNAKLVKAIFDEHGDELRYGMTLDDVNEWVNGKIEGGGIQQFTLRQLRERTSVKLPNHYELMDVAGLKLAKLIRKLFDGGITVPADMYKALHEDHGYPLWGRKVTDTLREKHPDLIPNFKEAKEGARRDQATAFLAEIKKRPGVPYADVARAVGIDPKEAADLVENVRRNDPDALPAVVKGTPYTDADKKLLRKVVDDAAIGAQMKDLYATLKATHPQFLERHPLSAPEYLGQALRTQIDVTDFRLVMQQKWTRAFADELRQHPDGVNFETVLRTLQDEHEGAYSRAAAQKIAKRWDKEPQLFPEMEKLRGKDGKLPFQRSRVHLTKALAEHVGKVVADNKGKGLPQLVKILLADDDFRAKYPRFNEEHVHLLRAAFPGKVPFVDEYGHLRTKEAREAAAARYKELAGKIEKWVDKHPATTDRKATIIARALGVSDRQVLSTLRTFPAKFPWWEPGATNDYDIYLATRAAVAMEGMKPGATRQSIVDELRKDPEFVKHYPLFDAGHNLDTLRKRYPDIVPAFHEAHAQLLVKTFVDKVVTSEKGATLREIMRDLRIDHGDAYPWAWFKEDYVVALIDGDPQRFPFADAIRNHRGELVLEGQGKDAPPADETNSQLAARLARLERIPDRLPLVDEVAKLGTPSSFKGFEVVAFQRLHESQVPLFEKMRELGLTAERAAIVGAPGAEAAVVDALADKGWDVTLPARDLDACVEAFKDALVERIAAAEESGRQVLVLDDAKLLPKVMAAHPELKAKEDLLRVVDAAGSALRVDREEREQDAEKVQITRGLTLLESLRAVGSLKSGTQALSPRARSMLDAAREDDDGDKKAPKAQRLTDLRLTKMTDDKRARR